VKTAKSLEDCIMFHKITVFTVERQKAYMMGNAKKPCQLTIRNHISRCKVPNGYIGHLPTLQDSQLVVTSTEKGNIPFNKATLASIVLSTCPTDWRNQYKMNHKTVLESTRSMTLNLEITKTSPQEGTLRQVLQVVQGGGWGPSDTRYQ
jgi:hypothetical protein